MSQKRARASVGMSWNVFWGFPTTFYNFSFIFPSKSLQGDHFEFILDSPCQNVLSDLRKSKISERKSVFTFFDPLRPKNIIFDRFFQLPEALEWDLFHPYSRISMVSVYTTRSGTFGTDSKPSQISPNYLKIIGTRSGTSGTD